MFKKKGKAKGEQTKATVKVKPKKDSLIETVVDPHIPNVYSANYSLIDGSIDEIKKASRKVSINEYATNNVYIILQDALKKVLNAEK